MKIEKKNGELEEILEMLKRATADKTPLSPKVSYAIIKNKLAIETALQAFYKAKEEIITKYSDGKGQITAAESPEAFVAANVEINIISKEVTELEISTIKLSELGENDLPLNLIAALGFMIVEG